MQNIEQARLQIMEDIDMGSLITNFKPASMQGSELKRNLTESLNRDQLQKITTIAGVVWESNKLRHMDAGAYALSESIVETLQSSIKGTIVYAFEKLVERRQNTMTERAMKTLNDLVILEEAQIKTKIRAGLLNQFKSINEVLTVIEAARLATDSKEDTAMHEAYVPVSYVEQVNENTFVRLGNNVLAIGRNGIQLASSPNTKFSFLSSVVEAMEYDNVNESFGVTHRELGTFTINEHSITRKTANAEDKETVYESAEAMVTSLNMIVETKANNTFNRKKINEQKQFIDSMLALKENLSSVFELDNSVVVENKNTRERFAMIIHEGKTFVGVLQSNRLPNIFERCQNINEGLTLLHKRSGYNAMKFFSDQVEIHETLSKKQQKEATALRNVIETLSNKEDEIKEALTEAKSAKFPRKEKIDMLNGALAKTKSIILEQRTNLQSYIESVGVK